MEDEEVFNVIIGKNISRMRGVRGLTQEELAKALHVPLEEAQRYEHGTVTPSPAKLFQLAGLFRCSIDDLFGIRQSLQHRPVKEHQFSTSGSDA